MIITLTGAQSSGKSTLLNHLASKNDDYTFIPEVTRLVKRMYDLPINEAGTDMTQLMICSAHAHNALLRDHQHTNVILDRCSLDGLVYTTWMKLHGKVNRDTLQFAQDIFENTITRYSVIFYTSPENIVIEDDGERSVDKSFRDDIIELFNDKKKHLKNVVTLHGSVHERLQQIQSTLKNLGLQINI